MARILVVDDSPTDIAWLKGILAKAGHEVEEATSGEEAIARVRRGDIDAVLMDVVMPGVNGFQATRTLARDERTAKVPIIVVSSKNQETDRLWALRQGAREYLTKPVKERDLLDKLEAVLGSAA